MKEFKDFLFEAEEADIRKKFNLDPNEYILFYRDKWIIDTKHAIERKVRGSLDDAKKLFKRSIDSLLDKKLKTNQVYLIASKSLKIAAIVDYRKDIRGRVKGNNLILITWLGDYTKPPMNKKSPGDIFLTNPNDKRLIVEYKDVNIYFDEVIFV